ncbi:MAG: presqualene diphosphate synthase HpnD [Planctomycetota bacterium]
MASNSGATPAWPPGLSAAPEQVAHSSRSSFLTAFALLEESRRRGLTAVYAFCRVVDDSGDDAASPQLAREALEFWRSELDRSAAGKATTPIGRALNEAIVSFGVAPQDLREVIDGVEMDVARVSYETLTELERYCRKVASAVGLACLPVFGANDPNSREFADQLGLALQLTNILRDLRQDAEEDRIYVPRSELDRFGVVAEWLRGHGPIAAYAAGGPVAKLVASLASEAEARFANAYRSLPATDRRALRPAVVMGEVYRELLKRVKHRAGRIDCPGRVRVPRWRKLAILSRVVLLGR